MSAPAPLITAQEVAAYLNSEVSAEPGIEDTVAGVIDLIVSWKGTPPGGVWPARWREGAKRLAGATVRSRNSPMGVEDMVGQLGTVGFIRRMDPQAEMLLEVGYYRKPLVG